MKKGVRRQRFSGGDSSGEEGLGPPEDDTGHPDTKDLFCMTRLGSVHDGDPENEWNRVSQEG